MNLLTCSTGHVSKTARTASLNNSRVEDASGAILKADLKSRSQPSEADSEDSPGKIIYHRNRITRNLMMFKG